MRVGKTFEQSIKVSEGMLASTLGSGQVNVFATPIMILKMEETSSLCVADDIGQGNVTVGTDVVVSHLAPTPVGRTVKFKSELIEINGKVLKFQVSASDDKGVVGRGTHTRVIVDKQKFEEKASL